jgi:hypothetical protein
VGVPHAVLTCLVVVVTANHWWLDGIVAVAIMGAAWVLQDQATHLWVTRRRREPAVEPDSAVVSSPTGS